MKRLILLVLLATGIGLASFGGYYSWHSQSTAVMEFDELNWLRTEFNLDPDQFAQVQKIHAQYQPICDALCARVIEAQERLDRKMITSASYTVEIADELARFSRVKEDCHRAMLQHLYEVAAVMGPDERKRYLEKASIQVTMHDRVHP
jgi:hypothetical protein